MDRPDPNWKDTNPKDALGIRRAPLSCISGPVLYEVGLAMLEGGFKYGRHNYRVSGVRCSVYFDALQRHLWDWFEGEDIDADSGLPHLAKAAACIFVIRDSVIRGNAVDDRPPKCPAGWVKDMTARAQVLLERLEKEFGDPKAPYTQQAIEADRTVAYTPEEQEAHFDRSTFLETMRRDYRTERLTSPAAKELRVVDTAIMGCLIADAMDTGRVLLGVDMAKVRTTEDALELLRQAAAAQLLIGGEAETNDT